MMERHIVMARDLRARSLRPEAVTALLLACVLGASPGCEREAPITAADPTSASDAQPADTQSQPVPWFREVSAAHGISFTHDSGRTGAFMIPEMIGGGGALIDIEQNGWMDLYLVQSGPLITPGETVDDDGTKPVNRLFRNTGGIFEDITDASGTGHCGYGMGTAVGDIDNDGFPDLYVTNLGPNVLYRNNGNGTFTDISQSSGTDHPGWGVSVAFFDADRNGLLDLFVVTYLTWSPASERECLNERSEPEYCAPGMYNSPAADVLLRNLGDGRFEDVSESSGISSRVGTGLGIGCADFDQNGLIDVFVANDGMNDHLWMNQGNFIFTEEALRRGCAVDEGGVPKAGMGVVVEDFTDNGQSDILVCNIRSESDSLFGNNNGWFTDITARAGLTSRSRQFTRFGIGAHDFDHDGMIDLFIANGRVARTPPVYGHDPYAEPNLLLRGTPNRRFLQVETPGEINGSVAGTSRAAVFGDLDNDGALDIVIVNNEGPAHVLRNTVGSSGNWIMFRMLHPSGRDALNARLTASFADPAHPGQPVIRHREVRSASSYLASNDPRVHFGLGDAEEVESLTVLWPEGLREEYGPFPAGAVHTLKQGSGRILPHGD